MISHAKQREFSDDKHTNFLSKNYLHILTQSQRGAEILRIYWEDQHHVSTRTSTDMTETFFRYVCSRKQDQDFTRLWIQHSGSFHKNSLAADFQTAGSNLQYTAVAERFNVFVIELLEMRRYFFVNS